VPDTMQQIYAFSCRLRGKEKRAL